MDEQVLADLARRTTEALTIISRSTEETIALNKSMREAMDKHDKEVSTNFVSLHVKVDGLMTTFKYVILPLVTGVLALVGVKMFFKL